MRGITLGVLSQGEMFQSYIDRVNGDGGQVKDLSLMYPFVSKLGSLGFSLITVPSAVKAGKLYSVFPADGSGDFIVNRNGEATYFDKDVLKLAGANEARIESKGLLVESMAVNLWPSSMFFQSGSVNKNGAPFSIFNEISPLELSYVYQPGNGTLQTGWFIIPITEGKDYSISVYMRTIDGLPPSDFFVSGLCRIMIQNTGNVETSVHNISGNIYRVSGKRRTTGVQSNHGVYKDSAANGRAFDVIGFQFEENTTSSYIPTSGSQITRPADQVSLSDLQGKGFLSSTEGSIFLNKDGDKILDIYQGGNKTTYKNGILQGIVSAPVPTSYLLEPGIYKSVAMKNQALTAGEAIELTSNGLLP